MGARLTYQMSGVAWINGQYGYLVGNQAQPPRVVAVQRERTSILSLVWRDPPEGIDAQRLVQMLAQAVP